MSRPWKIMGVDNGTTHLGLSLLEYDFDSTVARVSTMDTVDAGEQAYATFPYLVQRKGYNAARRSWIQIQFREYLIWKDPDVVAIETPFIGSRRTMSSFEPLALSLDGLIDVILEVEEILDKHIPIELVSPHEAKRAVTPSNVRYNPDKEAVPNNIMQHRQIDTSAFDLDTQSPDAIDAIAIGFTVVTRMAKF